jgi:hypothetical protein
MKSASDEGVPNNIIRYVNLSHISINHFSLSFSEIKALQEIEDHENVRIENQRIEFNTNSCL